MLVQREQTVFQEMDSARSMQVKILVSNLSWIGSLMNKSIRIDLVSSNLSSDGVLMVSAPKKSAIEFAGGAKAISH